MRAVGDTYRRLIEDIESKEILVPFFSSMKGQQIVNQGEIGARYWQKNLESPVLFSSAITAILQDQTLGHLFLEIGPHPALAGPLRQIFKSMGSRSAYISTLRSDKNSTESFLMALGQLYVKAVPIDFAVLNPYGVVLTDLPTYPWHHEEEYWCESRLSREWRLRKFPHHDLLGSRTAESSDLEPSWRNIIRIDDIPWIRDHKIHDDVVFPFAGYICMAGEAVRQMDVDEISFSMRHTVVGTALVLREGKDTEIITSLRPVRLTDTLDSDWFEFTIASYTGSSWAKHCMGQVRGGSEYEIPAPSIGDLPRPVPSARWYDTMRKVGLNYGPEFQGLSNISAGTGAAGGSAVASVLNRSGPYESTYQLHPTTIDFFFQFFSVAASSGVPRHFRRLAVPISIEELYICRTEEPIKMEVNASSTPRGTITGDVIGVAAGKTVISAKAIKLSPLDSDGAPESTDRHAAARLEWLPDIDFIDPKELIHPPASRKDLALLVEKLSLVCIIETSHKLKSFVRDSAHLSKYHTWLVAQVNRAREGQFDMVQGSQDLTNLSRDEQLGLIKSLSREAASTEAAAAAAAVLRVFELSEAVFEGVTEPLEGLLQGGVLTDLYNYMDLKNCKDFIRVLSHNKPTMRILELGAGTGGATIALLSNLVSAYGERMYASYTYTDISAGFFIAAKERFKDYANIEYAVLDITKDPVEQGFEAESYDLVLAANVSHCYSPHIRDG
jgi:acyl transferase domain-containing protein